MMGSFLKYLLNYSSNSRALQELKKYEDYRYEVELKVGDSVLCQYILIPKDGRYFFLEFLVRDIIPSREGSSAQYVLSPVNLSPESPILFRGIRHRPHNINGKVGGWINEISPLTLTPTSFPLKVPVNGGIERNLGFNQEFLYSFEKTEDSHTALSNGELFSIYNFPGKIIRKSEVSIE